MNTFVLMLVGGQGRREEGDESEDEDFEEVPQKEGYEATVPDYTREQPQSSGRQLWKGGGGEEWVLSQLCAEEGDPTTGQVSVPTSTEPRSVWSTCCTENISSSNTMIICHLRSISVRPRTDKSIMK